MVIELPYRSKDVCENWQLEIIVLRHKQWHSTGVVLEPFFLLFINNPLEYTKAYLSMLFANDTLIAVSANIFESLVWTEIFQMHPNRASY